MVTRETLCRGALLGYAAFAIVAGVWLAFGTSAGFNEYAGGVSLAVTGIVNLVAGPRWLRAERRRRLFLFHSILIVVVAVLWVVFYSPIPVLGVVFSATVLATAGAEFSKLSPGSRKLVLTVHVGTSVTWLGAASAMFVLSVVGLSNTDGLRPSAYRFMEVFDTFLMIPLFLLSLGSGLALSLGTKWGVVRHWWVLAKTIISLVVAAFATVVQRDWILKMVAATTSHPVTQADGFDRALLVWTAGACLLLWTAVVLSVYKPWGPTRWGRHRHERLTAARSKVPATGGSAAR